MHLVTIDSREVSGRPGVLTDGGEILDLIAAPSTLTEAQWLPHSVISVLAAGEEGTDRIAGLLARLQEPEVTARLRATGALLPLAGTRLMAPVRRPGLILLTGMAAPEPGEPSPVSYIKSPHTAIGPGQTLTPPWSQQEGLAAGLQLGVVLRSPLHQASEQEAAAAMAAVTVVIDVSLPIPAGLGLASWRRYIDSKQFPGACPMGPALVTLDQFEAQSQLRLSMNINGVAGEQLAVNLAELPARIAALSRRYGFRPGDLIGFGGEPPPAGGRSLRHGDRVVASLPGVMDLEARISFPD